MPIYEYRCASCGFEKEFLQKMNEAPLTVCPECRKDGFTKLISAGGFQLKGTGWYATDFKGSGKPKETPKEAAQPACPVAAAGACPCAAQNQA